MYNGMPIISDWLCRSQSEGFDVDKPIHACWKMFHAEVSYCADLHVGKEMYSMRQGTTDR